MIQVKGPVTKLLPMKPEVLSIENQFLVSIKKHPKSVRYRFLKTDSLIGAGIEFWVHSNIPCHITYNDGKITFATRFGFEAIFTKDFLSQVNSVIESLAKRNFKRKDVFISISVFNMNMFLYVRVGDNDNLDLSGKINGRVLSDYFREYQYEMFLDLLTEVIEKAFP